MQTLTTSLEIVIDIKGVLHMKKATDNRIILSKDKRITLFWFSECKKLKPLTSDTRVNDAKLGIYEFAIDLVHTGTHTINLLHTHIHSSTHN